MTTVICWICVILGVAALLAFVVVLFAAALDLLEDTEMGSAIIDRIVERIERR